MHRNRNQLREEFYLTGDRIDDLLRSAKKVLLLPSTFFLLTPDMPVRDFRSRGCLRCKYGSGVK